MPPDVGGGPSGLFGPRVPFRTALRFWFVLGWISFGGPTGQIALMHTELVEKRKWIDDDRFLHALNYCMLLPGPEAQQLATYIGWLLHGTRGGIVAGALFVLPSVFIMLVLSWLYAAHGDVGWIAAIFFGLQPAVMAIVAHAVLRIGQKALRNGVMYAVAAIAFAALYFANAPFPLVVVGAGLLGLAGSRFAPRWFVVVQGSGASGSEGRDPGPRPGWRRAIQVISICAGLWFAPVLLVGLVQGWDGILVAEGVFFSKAAMVTFGGAYSVLPYVAQSAVEQHQWLGAEDMLSGLGLAETTPGPLIMVVQFVGFMGAWNHPGTLPPWLSGTLGALITTWVTFLPCFLWIFLGAPYIERLRDEVRLRAALSTITAAVVGVVLNLAVWFATHVVWPEQGGVNVFAIVVASVTIAGMLLFQWGVVPVVVASGAIGVLYHACFPR
jgi:chromate transporter